MNDSDLRSDFTQRQLAEVANQMARFAAAGKFVEKAEESHVRALVVELAAAKEMQASRIARRLKLPRFDKPHFNVLVKARQALADVHRIFQESQDIHDEESSNLDLITGEPSDVRYGRLMYEVERFVRSRSTLTDDEPIGMLGEMLNQADAAIDSAISRFVEKSAEPV